MNRRTMRVLSVLILLNYALLLCYLARLSVNAIIQGKLLLATLPVLVLALTLCLLWDLLSDMRDWWFYDD